MPGIMDLLPLPLVPLEALSVFSVIDLPASDLSTDLSTDLSVDLLSDLLSLLTVLVKLLTLSLIGLNLLSTFSVRVLDELFLELLADLVLLID